MRRVTSLGLVAALCAAVLGACGSSNGRAATTPTGSYGAPTGSARATASSPTTGANPNAPEVSPSGDIPDNQAFVKYTSHDRAYSVEVPEGWARTDAGSATTFTAHFNSIRIEMTKMPTAPTVATARSTDVPALQRMASGFSLGNVTSVNRTAGQAVLITYRAGSAADPVTGKRIVLDVERYQFWRNGTSVTLTLSAPKGSDNVDPWKKVTDSFSWSA
jgi:hypothetical protein